MLLLEETHFKRVRTLHKILLLSTLRAELCSHVLTALLGLLSARLLPFFLEVRMGALRRLLVSGGERTSRLGLLLLLLLRRSCLLDLVVGSRFVHLLRIVDCQGVIVGGLRLSCWDLKVLVYHLVILVDRVHLWR